MKRNQINIIDVRNLHNWSYQKELTMYVLKNSL